MIGGAAALEMEAKHELVSLRMDPTAQNNRSSYQSSKVLEDLQVKRTNDNTLT